MNIFTEIPCKLLEDRANTTDTSSTLYPRIAHPVKYLLSIPHCDHLTMGTGYNEQRQHEHNCNLNVDNDGATATTTITTKSCGMFNNLL